MRLCCLVLGLLAITAGDICSQWGGRGCPPTSRSGSVSPLPSAQAAREWCQLATDPGRWYCYRGYWLIGCYCPADGIYWDWDRQARRWLVAAVPADVPAEARAPADAGGGGSFEEEVDQNFGIDLKHLLTAETYRLHRRGVSQEVTRDDVYEALAGAGQLTDDSRKRRLTLIGPDPACKQALAELPTELRSRYLIQSYRPDHWQVVSAGFKVGGNPTVYLQDPPDSAGNGYVLWREDHYRGPATWQAVAAADPDYRPDRDPGPHQPRPQPLPGPAPVVSPASGGATPLLLGLAALAALALAALHKSPVQEQS